MSKSGAFFGGLTLGVLIRNWKPVGVLLIVFLIAVRGWWVMLSEPAKVLVALIVLSVIGFYAAWRLDRLPWATPRPTRGRARYKGEVDVPIGEGQQWVYVITEWRSRDDGWLDQYKRDREGRLHPDAVRHLVYIGLTNSLTHRFRQHAEDKHWWHSGLMFEVVLFGDRQAAAAREAQWITDAGLKRELAKRPRENYEHNPTYDRKRCEYMHRRRVETSRQEIAA